MGSAARAGSGGHLELVLSAVGLVQYYDAQDAGWVTGDAVDAREVRGGLAELVVRVDDERPAGAAKDAPARW